MEYGNEIEVIDLSKLVPPNVAILQFEDYQKQALVTADMGAGRTIEGFVRVCGLVGEAAELRDELTRWPLTETTETVSTVEWEAAKKTVLDRIEEELGDVLWYAATLDAWLGTNSKFAFDHLQDMASMCSYEVEWRELTLLRAGHLAELMKKHLGHAKPMADFKGREKTLMEDVFVAIAFVSHMMGLELSYVAAKNIAKLRARYQGGGFTTQLANAHVDELQSKP